MKPYDFLSPEERIWIARCQVAAILIFLGLLAAVALAENGRSPDTAVSASETTSRSVGAESHGVVGPRAPNLAAH
jgi:hypothetical protein